MRQECAHLLITEEPDELIAHVRIFGGIAPATGRFYPEAERKGSGVFKMAVLISGFSFFKGFGALRLASAYADCYVAKIK